MSLDWPYKSIRLLIVFCPFELPVNQSVKMNLNKKILSLTFRKQIESWVQ